MSTDLYTKLTHHVNKFNCSKCIFSRFYCCWIVDEKQLYFPSIWCKQTFCEEERCESRWPRFALSVTEWGGWHLPYMGVCIQFDTSKLTDISKYIFDKPQMAYTKWQSDRVVWVDYEGGICHTWDFASSLIHSNWPIYPNIPTDWTGVCFQKQFWESEFEGLMSADHITSLPCEQVSSTTPNFEIVLIICDHILATTVLLSFATTFLRPHCLHMSSEDVWGASCSSRRSGLKHHSECQHNSQTIESLDYSVFMQQNINGILDHIVI